MFTIQSFTFQRLQGNGAKTLEKSPFRALAMAQPIYKYILGVKLMTLQPHRRNIFSTF